MKSWINVDNVRVTQCYHYTGSQMLAFNRKLRNIIDEPHRYRRAPTISAAQPSCLDLL